MPLGMLGKYERLDVLGHGVSGIVYLARDTLLGKQVALKEIDVQAGDMSRFLEEARVMDRLRHPHIVRVNGVDRIDGKVVIDMEYVRGQNLQELLRQEFKLPVPRALDIIAQTLDALDYAHQMQTVHRDIKPANILLDRDGVVKLGDFGLAEILTTNAYAGGAGTYAYMAPEDFSEEARSDQQSDVWAVGVTLYEMVSGQRPFQVVRTKDPFAWKRTLETEWPTPVLTYLRDAPPALGQVLDRALARDKALRYNSAGAFRGDVLHLLRGEPVSPRTLQISALLAQMRAQTEPGDDATVADWRGAGGAASRPSGPLSSPPTGAQPTPRPASEMDLPLPVEWLDKSQYRFPGATAGSPASASSSSEMDFQIPGVSNLTNQLSGVVPAALAGSAAGGTAGAVNGAGAALPAAVYAGVTGGAAEGKTREEKQSQESEGQAGTASRKRGRFTGKQALPHVRLDVETVDFGAVRKGETPTARVTVRTQGADDRVEGRVLSQVPWLTVHPNAFVGAKQTLTLTAHTDRAWETGDFAETVRVETRVGAIELPVHLTVTKPRLRFGQVAAWYLPLFGAALLPALSVAFAGGGRFSSVVPAASVTSGLLSVMLLLICIARDTGWAERVACVLSAGMMCLVLGATAGAPGASGQGVGRAFGFGGILVGLLLLQMLHLRRWKLWAGVLTGAGLLLASVLYHAL